MTSQAPEKALKNNEKGYDKQYEDPKPPPETQPQDGGGDAWFQGFVNAYGAYSEYYRTELLSSNSSSSISWIGSIEGFLLVIGGVLTGPIYDHGYFRSMLLVGAVLFVFGVMMLSLADQYYQILLAQGICMGLASGILYVPSLALVAVRFQKRRALAIGVATCGSSIGGVIYPIMFRRLQPSIGFGWATRTMGFLALFCFLISFGIMLPKAQTGPRRSRKLFEVTAARDVPFLMFTLGGFFIFMAFWVPYFYIASFARIVVGASTDLSFYTLAITNGASLFGRLLAGYIADRVGPLQTLMVCATICGVLIFGWIGVDNVAGLIVWAVFWGFFSGVKVSVPAAVVPLLCPSPDVIGARIGMAWAGAAVGILIGNPIFGALAGDGLENFVHAQAFSGAIMVLGAACDLVPLAHIIKQRRKREGEDLS